MKFSPQKIHKLLKFPRTFSPKNQKFFSKKTFQNFPQKILQKTFPKIFSKSSKPSRKKSPHKKSTNFWNSHELSSKLFQTFSKLSPNFSKLSQTFSTKNSPKLFWKILGVFAISAIFLAQSAPTQAQTFDLPARSPEMFLRSFCTNFLQNSQNFQFITADGEILNPQNSAAPIFPAETAIFLADAPESFAQNSQFFKILCGDFAPWLFDDSFDPEIQSRTGLAIARVQSGANCDRRPREYTLEFCDFPALATDFLRPVLEDFFALKKSQILGAQFGQNPPTLDERVTKFLQTHFLILPEQKPFNFPSTRRELRKYFRDGQNLSKTTKILNPEFFLDTPGFDRARPESLNFFADQILFEQFAFDLFLDSYGYRVEIHAQLTLRQKQKILAEIERARLAIHESIDTALSDLLDFNFSYKIFLGQLLYTEILDEIRHKLAGAMTPLRALPTLFKDVQIPEN